MLARSYVYVCQQLLFQFILEEPEIQGPDMVTVSEEDSGAKIWGQVVHLAGESRKLPAKM